MKCKDEVERNRTVGGNGTSLSAFCTTVTVRTMVMLHVSLKIDR